MSVATTLRRVAATRYATALREGGSLPGLVEADDDGLYVAKFTGAGQGPAALVSEVVVGELARALGLLVPELVVVEVDPALVRAEPDPEIRELVQASAGPNLGVDFLPGALPFSAASGARPDPALAADVVWLDALTAERRPHAAQPQPAALARPHVADRPRRRAVPPRHPGTRTDLPAAPSTCCCPTRARSPRPTSAWPRAWTGPARRRGAAGAGGVDVGVVAGGYLAQRLRAPRGFVEEAERARARL